MATGKATILTLPNEILDRIFSYQHWTPDKSLTPLDPDLTNISLSCHVLRDAVLPSLFRNARLKLRWVDGAIAEPGIYKLRREAPDIAKLVRCVHVQTVFGQSTIRQLKPFAIPLALADWNTACADDTASDLEIKHRMHIRDIALELYGPFLSTSTPVQHLSTTDDIARAFFGAANDSAVVHTARDPSDVAPQDASLGEHALHCRNQEDSTSGSGDTTLKAKRNEARRRRLQLDALITCMMSLPPQMHSLIFEATPTDHHDQLQHSFALQCCAMATRIFASKLQSVTMISRSLNTGRRVASAGTSIPTDDYETTLLPVISDLQALTDLTLASTTGVSDRLSKHSLDAIRASLWQTEPLCSNVTHVSLRNITEKRNGLFELIEGFTSLTDLTIDGVKMSPVLGAGYVHAQVRGLDDPMWLLFLISLRLHRPTLRFHLGNLCQWQSPETLPSSAVKWLMEEAVPVGADLCFERETRLTQDFGSFIPLWITDDSDRGEMAREDKGLAKLADDAFSSRGKTFENMR